MSMVINLVEDHNIYLCEGGPVYNGGVQPTPITYLTQWKIVGNSEVHTLPYPDGIVLPDGYKRCEYLTFDGSSYIDTNTTIDADTIVETAASTAIATRWLLGSRTSDTVGKTNVCFGMYGYGGVSDKLLVGHGSSNNQILTGSNLLDDTKHSIIIENDKLTFDSVEYSLNTRDEYNSNTMFIGALKKQDGTPHTAMWKGNIYDTIIYNIQGELWHGIPCLDANDVPCFYDIVSQTAFYNQGSGSFTYKLYPQPTEIWSCGEYNATDGKYHILVQPLGGSIADIALTEPLRKVNDVVDTIEFPSETEGKALVTRPLKSINIYDYINSLRRAPTYSTSTSGKYAYMITNLPDVLPPPTNGTPINGLCSAYIVGSRYNTYLAEKTCISVNDSKDCHIYDPAFDGADDIDSFKAHITEVRPVFIYELATPTAELVDAPQIAVADSYTCEISQGGKAVEWSSFETE